MIELSAREQEVAELVAAGRSNRQIAERLFITERTAEFHVEQIRNKLGFRSRAQIASWVTARRFEVTQASPAPELPTQLTTFVGRTHELRRVESELEGRCVTLVGAPGIGKTRLALEVAAAAGARFRGFVWFVELAPVTDATRIEHALAGALGVGATSDTSARDAIVSAIERRRVLVVIDNCEHLVRSVASLVEDLLSRCPGLHVLATSRERLGVSGETVYRVPPLAQAQELFCQRAAQADAGFEWVPLVATICGRLDGLPLAIELAAARVGVMSLGDIASDLEAGLGLLDSAPRSAAARQQSVDSAIEWSYGLLEPDERRVLCRASVFAGAFRLDAGIAVCGPGLRDPARCLLSLAEKSLLARAGSGSDGRYRLLAVVRQYAAARIEGADADRAHRLHFEHYLGLAEAISPTLEAGRDKERADALEAEMDNIRAALEWSEVSDPAGCMRLALAASAFWLVRGSVVEGASWLQRSLDAVPERSRMRGNALWMAAMLTARHGDDETSSRYNRAAAQLFEDLGDWKQLARVLCHLAQQTDDACVANRLLAKGLRSAHRSGDLNAQALTLDALGARLAAAGRTGRARARIEASMLLRQRSGHERGVAWSHLRLADLALADGDPRGARRHLAEALAIVTRLDDPSGTADVLDAVARTDRDPKLSSQLTSAAAALRDRTGDARFRDAGRHLQPVDPAGIDEAVARAREVTAEA